MSHHSLAVVTRPRAGLGFRLAGARVEEVEAAEVAERVRALLADRTLGILAVEEALLGRVPETLLDRAAREGVPVLLPFTFPARWEEGGHAEEYVAALVRRAIGYHVRIRR